MCLRRAIRPRLRWAGPQPVEDCMHRYVTGLTALGIGLAASLPGNAQTAGTGGPSPVTAIDIVLEPDATMVRHAEAANERLRKEFPKGFALDATHHPHVSTLQRYVRTADLNKVYEAVSKVLAQERPNTWKLK